MSLSQLFTLEVEDVDVTWRVVRVTGIERLHEPYSFEIDAEARDGAGEIALLSAAELLMCRAKLGWTLADDSDRAFEGVLVELREIASGYRLVLSPSIALLGDTVDYQVFRDQDAVEIATAVLREHQIEVTSRVLRAPRRSCSRRSPSARGALPDA